MLTLTRIQGTVGVKGKYNKIDLGYEAGTAVELDHGQTRMSLILKVLEEDQTGIGNSGCAFKI